MLLKVPEAKWDMKATNTENLSRYLDLLRINLRVAGLANGLSSLCSGICQEVLSYLWGKALPLLQPLNQSWLFSRRIDDNNRTVPIIFD